MAKCQNSNQRKGQEIFLPSMDVFTSLYVTAATEKKRPSCKKQKVAWTTGASWRQNGTRRHLTTSERDLLQPQQSLQKHPHRWDAVAPRGIAKEAHRQMESGGGTCCRVYSTSRDTLISDHCKAESHNVLREGRKYSCAIHQWWIGRSSETLIMAPWRPGLGDERV